MYTRTARKVITLFACKLFFITALFPRGYYRACALFDAFQTIPSRALSSEKYTSVFRRLNRAQCVGFWSLLCFRFIEHRTNFISIRRTKSEAIVL